jgi:hypothetical protein
MVDIVDWMPEFKVSAESDRDLMRYFVKTPLIKRVVGGERWMIIGRKGTGKTALFEYLKQAGSAEIEGYTTIALNFKDYPWPIQKLYREAMESEISAYQRSWRYVIIIKALSRLIEARSGNLSKELSSAKKLIESLYGSPTPGLIEIVKSKALGLKSFNLPEIEAAGISLGGVEFEEIAQHEDLKRTLRANAFQLLDHFEKILKNNIGSDKLMVVLDQLDENWLEGEIDEYSKILVNLIICAQGMNNQEIYRDKLRIVIFLRADIYETLRFNDKNKIYQDGAVEIKWDYDALDKMIAERIEKYRPTEVTLDLTQRSASIFEKKTVRHGVPPLKHMLRRSFYRPRDVIVYLNKIRDLHKPSASGLYTSKDLYAAERTVSSSMYDELIDEWGNQKPDFEMYLMVLQNIGTEIFSKEQYIEGIRGIRSEISDGYINEILLFLFNNSIIGQKLSVNWGYVCTNPHLQINYSKPFHVNNGLKYRLVLKESRERQKRTSSVDLLQDN